VAVPLVLAAIVDDGPLSPFAIRALAEIAALPGVHLALLVSCQGGTGGAESTPSALTRFFLAADRWHFNPRPAVAVSPEVARRVSEVPRVRCVDAAALRNVALAHRVEAIIEIGNAAAPFSVEIPLGTWCLSYGGLTAPQAAVSSVLGEYDCLRTALISRAEPSRVLAESISARDHVSAARTLTALEWKGISLVRRGVHRLQRDGGRARPPAAAASATHPIAPVPSPQLLWRVPGHVARAAVRRRARQRGAARWALLIGRRDGADIAGLEPAFPPPGCFWADPFVVSEGSARYVFFEEYRHDRARGRIVVAQIKGDGRLGAPVVALERPYHLSYPFVFTHDGEWYMVPETQANRTIEVYRCDQFPDRWRFSHVLMPEIRAVDATIVLQDDRWWLFANVAELEGSSTHDELAAFWADSPLSTRWHPHRSNPIVADVRRARPAGPFMRRDGRLIRPSQDSSTQYGGAIRLNEVISLTETDYEERPIGVYDARWDSRVTAIHTLSEDGGVVCIDGKVSREEDWPAESRAGGRCPLLAAEGGPS